ncbi:meiosis-specific protein ASY3 isoform X1 [Ziziphus jujuba]|uniref:Meiosis-specific protein ASY3 isoform X1 n=2 Tax=Ziziphus jujuba TaxID=326968 RepID=A0ABM4AHZ3_ZIZJJ|nr:meiosis-specific protein ASY3 isoform X1 [Ziziphus jujuba]
MNIYIYIYSCDPCLLIFYVPSKIPTMQVAAQQFRDGQTSQCWSFGSTNHPSSQTRKISVGVMADLVSKKKSEATKEDEIAMLDSERMKSDVGNSTEGKRKNGEVAATKKTQRTEAPEQVNSPWITTTGTFHPKAPTSETVLFAEQTSNLPASGRQYQVDGAKNTPFACSVQFFANNASVLRSDDINRNKFDGVTYERRGRKDGLAENLQEFQFAAVQDVLVMDKDRIKDAANTVENRRTESLKMKLQEILQTVSSPNDHHSKSSAHELGASSFNPEQKFDQMGGAIGKPRPNSNKSELKFDQMGDTVVKPAQNSDTIETDSEGTDHRIRRPVTRSLTQKRAPTKQQQNTTKSGRSPGYKRGNQEKNIFTFEEGWSGRLAAAVSGGSSMPAKKMSGKKSFRPRKICFADRDAINKIHEATYRIETQLPAQETYSLGERIKDFKGSLPENERKYVPEKNILEHDSHRSPQTNKIDQRGDFDTPDNRDQQEGIGTPSLKNVVNPQDEFQSPTLGIKTPLSSSSPSFRPKTDHMVHCHGNPALAKRVFTVGELRSVKSLMTSKLDYSSAHAESSDGAEELKNSPVRKATFEMEEKNTEDGLSESSSEGRSLPSPLEGSPSIEGNNCFKDRETPFPETSTAEELKFMFRPTKRLCSDENITLNYIRIGESSERQEPSECNQLDGLDRAVELFMRQIEKLNSKMKLVTSKKTSEILMSAAENIHLQLQNVESQIQIDVGKLTSLSKLKRKWLEARFQEQQEQLKLIYEKFKEEVDQHLQDCRSTFEGLEADQLEFKGNMEKQKALQRKLLLQVEEGIETLVSDAQRRIRQVREASFPLIFVLKLMRGKMTQLKQVIALCLKEGVLG